MRIFVVKFRKHMKHSQLARFKLIDELLYMNEDGISTADLHAKVDRRLKMKGVMPKTPDGSVISKRQIEYDLGEMRDAFDAPISYNKGQRKVKYTDMTYCAFKSTYDVMERQRSAGTNLSDKSKGRLEWLKLWISHVQNAKVSDLATEAVDFEDNLSLTNLDMLPKLLEAIIQKKVLFLSYKKGFGDNDYYTVSPYFLRQYNQRWYLFAYKRSSKRIQSFPVDRIRSIDTDDTEKFKEISLARLREYKAEYFGRIVGVTNREEDPVIDLRLSFRKNTEDKEWDGVVNRFYNLLKSNPFLERFVFSGSEEEDTATAKDIKVNRELENKLIVYAHAARISDDALRNKIVKRARRILSTQEPK